MRTVKTGAPLDAEPEVVAGARRRAVADEIGGAVRVGREPRLDGHLAGERRAVAGADGAGAGEARGGVGFAAERAVGAEGRRGVRAGPGVRCVGRGRRPGGLAQAPVVAEAGRRGDGLGVAGGLRAGRGGGEHDGDDGERQRHEAAAGHRSTRSQSCATRSFFDA